jgi:serine/threonine-protein kinase
MLVGEVPFNGPNAIAIMARHTMEQVPSIQIVRNSVPDELEDAIHRALEKVPADRFPSVAQFKEALLGQGNTTTYARRTRAQNGHRTERRSNPRGLWNQWSRRKTIFAAASAIALLASGGVAAKFYLNGRPTRAVANGDIDPRRIGVLYFADESKDGQLRFLADALTESLIDELSRVPVLHVVSSNAVRPFRGTPVEADSVGRALKVGSVVRGEVDRSNKGVKVTVRLVDPASNVEIKRKSFDVDTAHIVSLQGEVANQVARYLREELGEEVRLREGRQMTGTPEAWLLVQRAAKRRKDADSLFAASQRELGVAELDSADALLMRASALDAESIEPLVARASLADRKARALQTQPHLAAPAIDTGLALVERVLAIDARNADAYYYRGDLRFVRFMLHLISDAAEADRTLAEAEADLHKAVDLNPNQAGAWSTLSALYYLQPNPQRANQALREAYRADAYLTNAPDILQRLFWTSHDTEAYPDAEQWCAEGRRRFPRRFFFTECALWMMTTKAARQDPDSAWRLYAALQQVTPERAWPFESRNGQILVAGALARAGLSDSARHVLLRARVGGDATIDPRKELVGNEAVVRAIIGDYDETVRLIEQYLVANPEHWRGFAKYTGPWWRDPKLQTHPKFKALIAGAR